MGMINRKKKRTRFSSSYTNPTPEKKKEKPNLTIVNDEQKDKVEVDLLIKKINSLIQSEEKAKKATLIISEWINNKK